ncbi:MAG: UDP-N-acetylmuramate dehydrogenase, partial [Anaerolineales bacterium]
AESGVNFGNLARLAAELGLSGLEWAIGIPGTVGGAVVNNAGAFGGDIAHSLIMAEILQQDIAIGAQAYSLDRWTASDFDYSYRGSRLKNKKENVVVLNASFKVYKDDPQSIKMKIMELSEKRQKSQPSGASLGSIFKNPIGDYAGRLIEEAGLKGLQMGGARISREHANFIITSENACAKDVWDLINIARQTVWEKYGIWLELEIQLLGQFPQQEKQDAINFVTR